MKKFIFIFVFIIFSASVYAADEQLTSGDLNCLQEQKHQGEIKTCLPSKKPDNCSEEDYEKLKSSVQECSFKVRGALRSAL
ncbi:hypothetical protein [Francisella orientalis]|nr:hypothetical protein [Francisella orientalis]AFJ44033.1 hypothetical protein OOM_1665 [Francisella orientalis str. Toba 04]AKN85794.1 hypothetical protein FNO12_1195 [Francisella orientalis FNO12]AKN87333.1 Hypothetical protein FNO24_1197 [Francisella orientalis FNO24]AKN88870.1 Hypothetical protein FNO190_1195 [Francisella orientalis]AKU05629.1 Hypothetical protein FNO01_1195 [Francisella orientalis]